MNRTKQTTGAAALIAAAILIAGGSNLAGQRQDTQKKDDAFKFKSGVELINVTATVIDKTGRFVPGLRQEDFALYENNVRQEISHFSNERVPVSLGIVLDTSGSMAGEKLTNALSAIDRFLGSLLDPTDEIFIYRLATYPELLQDWTTDRQKLSRAVHRMNAGGATAMYDTLAEAVPMAQTGQNRKKAVVLISDGNDTNSDTTLAALKQLIRQTEVLVYAIGIDGYAETSGWGSPAPRGPQPIPFPLPIPGRRRGGIRLPFQGYQFPPFPGQRRGGMMGGGDERVNVDALRQITDDSGGRTEIVRTGKDLDPATANIADELSRQYYIGYSSTEKKDGLYHTIRLEVKDPSLKIRARHGYVATP
ncbi:MAG TPA: VWA domain-containing protein [Vicinamibacterales bacterium]|jgi:VWFA-related protein|nr:VWA domain-containing protein [Vicinamibacterales bacterium]